MKAPELKDSSWKVKVWCMLCFEARIACKNALDEGMVVAGTQEVVRSRPAIEDMGVSSGTSPELITDTVDLVWAQGQSDPARGWLISHTTTLVCHLQDCELQPKSVRD